MDAVEDIKQRLSIEDVIGEYVQLKRAGRNFKGLSPFKPEKTASFIVSPEKQIWHDFSSGKGGNLFSFVMEMEGLDFRGALELLARKAGIDLAQYDSDSYKQSSRIKKRLYEALELSTKFYQVQLKQNKTALEYVFKKRQLTKDIVLEFRIGYAPNTGNSLCSFLTKKGFSLREIQQAGLARKGYSRPTDMFTGRLMFPLADNQGRIVGFTSRIILSSDHGPKYLNTPQTLLYDKGRHVYGLHLAKEAIRSNKYAVVVEGNMDVIASHMIGVRQVIATAGTALTEHHLKAISNLTADIRIAFDQDSAGESATERAIPIASSLGLELSMVVIKDGKDADELVRENPEEWKKVIAQPVYAVDWLIEVTKNEMDIESAAGKRKFSDKLLPLIGKLADPVERDHYISKIAGLINVSSDALTGKMGNYSEQKKVLKKPKNSPKLDDETVIETRKNQDQLLCLSLIDPSLRKYLEHIIPEMLVDESAEKLLSFLIDNPEFSGDPLANKQLNKQSDYVKMLMLQYEALYQNLGKDDLAYEAKQLQSRLITRYVKNKQSILSEKMRNDNTQTKNLLVEANELNNLLKSMKEVVRD